MEIAFIKKIDNSYFNKKSFLGFQGSKSDLEILVKNIEEPQINLDKTVKSYIGKSIDYLKSLALDERILSLKLKDLSGTDLKLILLIKVILMKPELIILDKFELGINDRIVNRIIRFLKTINGAFEIKFVIISSNIVFLNKITKNVLCMKNGIVKYQGDLITAVKQNIFPKPKIIQFIDYANSKGAGLNYTLEEKELLKEVYRSVN